jgi:hypothetical protein
VENNINRPYNGEPYLDCTLDLFMVHMTGFITIPEHDTIEFWLASDDGGTIDIGGNEWGSWNDQGCSATESGQIDISAGSQSLDLWMYENGGGTCIMLAWNIDNTGFAIVPDEAFTTTGIPTDTTIPDTTIPDTTIPDTTIPNTTTTIQETTTTWATTTTSTTSTTTTTTSTIAPSTTVAVTPNLTTTTLQTTTSVASISETTLPITQSTTLATMPLVEYPTTTILLEPTTTFPEPPLEVVATVPYATVQPTYTLPLVVQDTIPPMPDIPLEPPTSLPNATETLDTVNVPSTTFPEDTPLLPTLSDAEFEAVLDDLKDSLPDEVTAIVTTLLTTEVTSEQAVQVVSSPEVLEVISGGQAEQLFDAVDESALTVEEQIQIVEAIADAPTEVKEAFENEINIFSGEGFNDYVPVDSNVSVAVRRTIIVGTTILVAMPSPVARRNRV